MYQPFVHAGLALCRAGLMHAPGLRLRRRVWYHLARPLAARCDVPLIATTRFGARMRLTPPDSVQTHIYCFGVWEPGVTAHIAASLGPGDVMVDVGANVGYDTLLAASRIGPTGRVHAIEASPAMFACLTENLRLNGTAGVVTHHAAVTDRASPVPIHLHDRANLGASTILPSLATARGARWEATVPGLPLPALVPPGELRAARLIKIDVEGAEGLVLRGLAPELGALSPRAEILVEVNAPVLAAQGIGVPGLLALMADGGFEAWEIPNTYQVEEYLAASPPAPRRLRDAGFEQADLLFRRPVTPAAGGAATSARRPA